MSIKGNIHSYESFGTVDGPGIRFVIFMQGCPLRCLYCHNPDTWNTTDAPIQVTPQELFQEALKYKAYFQKRGGITVSGGEPLLQAEFVTEFFKLCKQENIHTAVDTSGCLLNDKVKEMLAFSDLVLLDIKTINKALHKKLTGIQADKSLQFLDYLQSINKPVWIRHVIVPSITDNTTDLKSLALYLKQFTIIEKIDLLPYHTHGKFKYEELNTPYPLQDIPDLEAGQLDEAKKIFIEKGFSGKLI